MNESKISRTTDSIFILGVDPGMSGSIVLLSVAGRDQLQTPLLIDFFLPQKIKLGQSSRICSQSLAGWLSCVCEQYQPSHCFIEKVGAMPGQGVSSMFNFGHAAGVAEGAVSAMSIPIAFISPQAWKRAYAITGKDKDASRAIALRMFPTVKQLQLKGKGQAIADAALIALHGARTCL